MIATALVAAIKADSTLTALVHGRVFPEAPQNANEPYIVYNTISTPRLWDFNGPTGLTESRIQFDCFAGDRIVAKQIATAIRNLFDGQATTLSGYKVQKLEVDDERDLDSARNIGTEQKLFGRSLDIIASFEES